MGCIQLLGLKDTQKWSCYGKTEGKKESKMVRDECRDILGTGIDIKDNEDLGKLQIINQTEPCGRRLWKIGR